MWFPFVFSGAQTRISVILLELNHCALWAIIQGVNWEERGLVLLSPGKQMMLIRVLGYRKFPMVTKLFSIDPASGLTPRIIWWRVGPFRKSGVCPKVVDSMHTVDHSKFLWNWNLLHFKFLCNSSFMHLSQLLLEPNFMVYIGSCSNKLPGGQHIYYTHSVKECVPLFILQWPLPSFKGAYLKILTLGGFWVLMLRLWDSLSVIVQSESVRWSTATPHQAGKPPRRNATWLHTRDWAYVYFEPVDFSIMWSQRPHYIPLSASEFPFMDARIFG